MSKPLLILDCDGTLVDSIGAWHEAEYTLVAEAGMQLSKEQIDELNTLTLEETGPFFHERLGIGESSQAVIDAILAYLLDYYRARSQAAAGALEFVRRASELGLAMCVLSSSPLSFLQAGMERGGFLPYIEHIVSVEDLDTTKRDIATYQHVCALFGVDLADAWLFDDSWYALATARSAGCGTVGVFSDDSCGSHEELARYSDIVVDSLAELDPVRFCR